MCNASKSYGRDVRNIAKISPKMAKKQPFFDFFLIFGKTVRMIRTKFFTVLLHYIMVLYIYIYIYIYSSSCVYFIKEEATQFFHYFLRLDCKAHIHQKLLLKAESNCSKICIYSPLSFTNLYVYLFIWIT